MRYNIYKIFLAWDYEKEEKWLNEMSMKGLQLVNAGVFKYVFEEGEKGKYIYRLEFLNQFPSHPESISYIRFLEETGIEHVASFQRWIYLRKKASEGPFELYSDNSSRINHLRRIMTVFICLIPAEISAFSTNLHSALKGSSASVFLCCLMSVILLLVFFGIFKLYFKIRKLKKEQTIYE